MLMRRTQFKEIELLEKGLVDNKAKDPRRVMGLEHNWRDWNRGVCFL